MRRKAAPQTPLLFAVPPLPAPPPRPVKSGTRAGVSRRRAVLLDPQDRDSEQWIRWCAEYCLQRGYLIVAIASRLQDALHMLDHGDADVLVVARVDQLYRGYPIEIVADAQSSGRPEDRRHQRPRRTGRVWPPLE